MRRASKSVPLNIAEGYGRKRSDKGLQVFPVQCDGFGKRDGGMPGDMQRCLGYAAMLESAMSLIAGIRRSWASMLNGLIAKCWSKYAIVTSNF